MDLPQFLFVNAVVMDAGPHRNHSWAVCHHDLTIALLLFSLEHTAESTQLQFGQTQPYQCGTAWPPLGLVDRQAPGSIARLE